MSDADAVRAWLASFRGAIAAANYADEMIEAGYDSLDNMIFTKDELQESVASLNDKPGHAGRIARDAVKMVAEMGSVGPESPPEDIEGTDLGLGLADRIKMAGDAPPFPTGVGGKQVSRAQAEEWLDREIVWTRLWSKQVANALVMRRDKGSLGIESIRAACRVKETHEAYLGSTLLCSIQDTEKVHLTRDDRDRSMGLDMIRRPQRGRRLEPRPPFARVPFRAPPPGTGRRGGRAAAPAPPAPRAVPASELASEARNPYRNLYRISDRS